MANVSSSNTTTLYSTTQETVIQPGAAVATGQVNDANFTTLYTSGQQVNPNANLVVDGTLTVNGCAILTNCTSFNLLPTTATSINFGLEATALSIGSGSGTTLINNQLATANYTFPVADGLAGQVLVTNGAGVLSFAIASSVGKDYDISASSTTGGANFNLNSNVPTTDTIKFSNGTGVTVSQVNASEISFAIGQDVATTASPTFDNLNLNGALTVNADQTAGAGTINVYSGSTLGSLIYNGGQWFVNDLTEIVNSSATNNAAVQILQLQAQCSATPTVGFGGSLKFEIQTPSSGIVDTTFIASRLTDVTAGAEKAQYRLSLLDGGGTTVQRLIIGSTGDQLITGSQTSAIPVGIGGQNSTNDYWHIGGYSVGGAGANDGALEIATANNANTAGTSEPIYVRQYGGGLNSGTAWPWGNTIQRTLTLLDGDGNTVLPVSLQLNGSTSGYSKFTSAATSANIDYVLPAAQGAASTVLTNDGAGNLTWALPGGGGSQFGNITVGIVTDNTISTTTGDLILDSATNLVSVTADLSVDNNLTVNADQTGTATITAYGNTTANTITYNGSDWQINDSTRIVASTSNTNTGVLVADLRAISTGTTTVGFGPSLNFTAQIGAPGNLQNAGFIDLLFTDVTAGVEDTKMSFAVLSNGTLTRVADLNSNGQLTVTGDIEYQGGDLRTTNTTSNFNYTGTGTHTFNIDNVNTTTGNTKTISIGENGQSGSTTSINIGSSTVGATSTINLYNNVTIANQLNVTGDVFANDLNSRSNLALNYDNTPSFAPGIFAYSGPAGTTQSSLVWNGVYWEIGDQFHIDGALRLKGSSSGYTEIAAAATGASIVYTLPNAQGAANTVLTNDGSGNLSWALPGGGGSTFGNVSIGVVTDNTISTTTGDLDITSNTGVINLDTYTAFTDNRLTTTSTSTVTLDSLAIATYQSASYTITIKNTVTGATQFTKIDLLHDGAVAYIDQYSNMASVADLAVFSATISGANAVLQITPASANSTQFTFNRIATKV